MTELDKTQRTLKRCIDLIPTPKIINLENFDEFINRRRLIEEIRQIHGFRKKLYEELEKCETHWQELALLHLFKYFSWELIRAEKWFYDSENKKHWRVDIYVANLIIIEIDGKHHRLDDSRFTLDESKDDFFTENGYIVLRRSNDWTAKNYKKLPTIILDFLNNYNKRIFSLSI